MSQLADIREAIRARLADVGLRGNGYQTDALNTPHAMLGFEIPDYDMVFQGGAVTLPFTIWIFDQRADEIAAQKRFDEWLLPTGQQSVRAALHDDDTLDGLCDYVWVKSSAPPRVVRVGAVDYLMIEIGGELCFRPEEGP